MRTPSCSLPLLQLALLATGASAATITVAAGEDFEAVCLHVVEPGDTCYLEKGDYEHDGLTITHGTEDARITITGDPEACIKGSNTQDRVLQIAHDYYTVEGICFDGEHGGEHVATAIYVLGADYTSEKNGLTSSVTGFQMFNLEIKNFGSECVHFRYFVTHAEVSGCTIQNCGYEAFVEGGGGKVGEAIYVGTALDQVDDNKAPEVKLRSGSADNVDADVCSHNWIHHNTFRTWGNECVDIKEGSEYNLVEYNVCEQQYDENSGCMGSRGSYNTFRWNEIAECLGAGVRVGGDKGYGEGNNIYGNTIENVGNGAFNVMSPNQGVVCENKLSGISPSVSVGAEDHNQSQFTEADSTADCSSYPGDLDEAASPPSASDDDEETSGSDDDEDDSAGEAESDASSTSSVAVAFSEDDDSDLSAGVNYADGETTDPEVETIETNASAGSSGLGSCASVLSVSKALVLHPEHVDTSNEIGNLFDGDTDSYFSVHRESTYFTFELEEMSEVSGVSLGFFMKDETEERIQTFDIAVRDSEGEWSTVISRQESSGTTDMQTFPFTSHETMYVRLETHGNTFNNWSAFTEVEICGNSVEESNALFGGMKAVDEELEVLAGEVCSDTVKLIPKKVHSTSVESPNVMAAFDGMFSTRWSTQNTNHESDMDNDKIIITFEGDTRVSHIEMSFFDGQYAHQYFSVYKQSARAKTWTSVMTKTQAEKHEGLQTFDIDSSRVKTLYIVAKGNDVGLYTKFSEINVYGC